MTRNYTYNKFKETLKKMDNKEREEELKRLKAEMMYEKTLLWGMGQSKGSGNIRTLRKMIAITKTAINCWR